MKIVVELMPITPELAAQWLAESKFNRPIKPRVMTAYASTIIRDEWQPWPPLERDVNGILINGHHRCHAIIIAQKTVNLYVVTGLEREVQKVMDTGTKRGLSALLRMYRKNMSHIVEKTAAVNMCAYLLTGVNIPMSSLTEYDHWYSIFKEGLDWAVNVLTPDKLTRASPTVGGLAFAYKTDPTAIKEFGDLLVSGEQLADGDPAYALRRVLTQRGAGGGTQRQPAVRRVLNAAMAHINNDKMYKTSMTDVGRSFFQDAYENGRKARQMAEPWMPKEDLADDEEKK